MAVERRYKFKTEDDGNIVPLIGILVILIVLVAGAFYLLLTSGGNGEDPDDPYIIVPDTNDTVDVNETNQTNVTYVCDDSCHFDLAILNESVDECELISNETLLQDCYEQLSDVSLAACLEVLDPDKKAFCTTAFALNNDEIDLCDLLSEGRDSCKEAIDPCFSSTNEPLCRALDEEDPSYCMYDSDCLLDYSMIKQDASACKVIQNPVVAAGCESAIKKTDKCDDLDLQSERDYCYEVYAIYSDDYKVCTSITQDTSYRLNCLSLFAVSEGNYSICVEGGLNLDYRWACFTNYSLLAHDLSGCEEIHELASSNKFNCVFEYAKKFGEPDACELISSLPTRDTCYQGAIIYSAENLQPDHCDDISDFNWRNKCYNEAAKKYDDVSICDGLEEDFAHQACVDAYDLYKN